MNNLDELIKAIDSKIASIDMENSKEINVSKNSGVLDVLEKIKNGDDVNYLDMYKINVDDLLLLDNMNVSYLEYACRRKLNFSLGLQKKIANDKNALFICCKNNHLSWLYTLDDEDIFFEKVDGDNTLVDIILGNDVKVPFFISKIKKHYEIIDYMIKYNNFNYYQISNEILELLFTEHNGSFLIDKYIDNKKLLSSIIGRVPVEMLLNYCKVKARFDILANANEKTLLTEFDNDITVLEELLNRKISPTFEGYDFLNKKTLDILIQRGRMDLLYNADLNLLFLPFDSNRSYFDLMMEEQKKGHNMNLEKMSGNYYKYSSEIIAKKLMTMAKNDLIGFIPEITAGLLLYQNEKDVHSVIEWLIQMDKDLTLSSIIRKCRDSDKPNFVIALRNLGIDNTPINIQSNDIEFSDECIKMYNDEYASGYTSKCEDLLTELRDLFYNDGKSDKSAIDALITSYRYLTSTNNDYAILEIRQIIEIKKRYPDKFTYTKIPEGAYFNVSKGGVFLDNDVISTINHETSHALHYYLAGNYVPDNYFEVIEQARNNPELVFLTKEYSKKFLEIKNNVLASVSKSDISNYYDSKYTGDKLVNLAKFLSSSKDEQRKKFKDSYPQVVLDTILAKTYSVDEFIAQRKEIEIKEVVDATMRNDYGAFIAIGDIIDAIYLGKYRNGVLVDDSGLNIPSAYGHGISYYSMSSHGFDEMIADYGEILKSKNGNEMLIYLRSIVGDELVDMIENCYMEKILYSSKFIKDIEFKEENNHAR